MHESADRRSSHSNQPSIVSESVRQNYMPEAETQRSILKENSEVSPIGGEYITDKDINIKIDSKALINKESLSSFDSYYSQYKQNTVHEQDTQCTT